MRIGILLLALVFFCIALNPLAGWAGPANPRPVEVVQPDGTVVEVRLVGDEWYHCYESLDGYAVVPDRDGRWVYADLDGAGEFVPTAHALGVENGAVVSFKQSVGPHLRETAAQRTERRERFEQRTLPELAEKAASLAPAMTGIVNVPVVLMQYPDYPATQSAVSFSNMMNQFGYNGTGSFRDYYLEVSQHSLTVQATVVGWYTAPYNRFNYRDGAGTYAELAQAKSLARAAVDSAEIAGFDWGPFDNDGDGRVDVVFVVHQGHGAECGAAGDSNYVWSHAWFLNDFVSDLSVQYDGKLIDRYLMVPEEDCSGAHEKIGIYCHEFGHAMDLPDLYDVDYSSAGIGIWGLMAYGHWGGDLNSPQTPTHLCAWSRVQAGFVAPQVVTSNVSSVSLWPGMVYQLWTNGAVGKEYFLVENRALSGFDANLPGGGLAVWHVDDNMATTTNTDNAVDGRRRVDLEEADAAGDLDSWANTGDAGDLYPGSSSNTLFDGASTPDSRDHLGCGDPGHRRQHDRHERLLESGPGRHRDHRRAEPGDPRLSQRQRHRAGFDRLPVRLQLQPRHLDRQQRRRRDRRAGARIDQPPVCARLERGHADDERGGEVLCPRPRAGRRLRVGRCGDADHRRGHRPVPGDDLQHGQQSARAGRRGGTGSTSTGRSRNRRWRATASASWSTTRRIRSGARFPGRRTTSPC